MTIIEALAVSMPGMDTIRFGEKAGMLPPLPCDGRGWWIFDACALGWITSLARRLAGLDAAQAYLDHKIGVYRSVL